MRSCLQVPCFLKSFWKSFCSGFYTLGANWIAGLKCCRRSSSRRDAKIVQAVLNSSSLSQDVAFSEYSAQELQARRGLVGPAKITQEPVFLHMTPRLMHFTHLQRLHPSEAQPLWPVPHLDSPEPQLGWLRSSAVVKGAKPAMWVSLGSVSPRSQKHRGPSFTFFPCLEQ